MPILVSSRHVDTGERELPGKLFSWQPDLKHQCQISYERPMVPIWRDVLLSESVRTMRSHHLLTKMLHGRAARGSAPQIPCQMLVTEAACHLADCNKDE